MISLSSGEKLFLGATFVSLCGDSLIPIAFSLESLRIDPTGAGFTTILLALWGGRFVGTLFFRRCGLSNLKQVMIGSDLVRVLAQAGLCVWIVLLNDSIIAMAVSSVIYGLATAFFVPSRFTLTPEVVSEKNLEKFNSLVSLLTDSLMVIAPAVSTAIFLWVGFAPILIFDVVTFTIGILLLLLVKADDVVPSLDAGEGESVEAEESKNHSLNDFKAIPKWSALGLLMWVFITLIIGYSGAAGPSFIISRFSETDWAVVATALAVGSIVGSASQLIGVFQKMSWKLLQVLAGLLICLQILSFSISPSLVPVVLLAFIASLAMTSAGIAWDTVVQKSLKPHELRIFANWDSLLTTGTVPLGMAIFGLGSLFGVQGSITVVISVLCTFSVILFFLHSRSLETE